MAKDADSVLNAGVVALLVKHAAAYYRQRGAQAYLERAKAVIKEQEKVQRDAVNALRLFGIDADDGETWDRLVREHNDEIWALLQDEKAKLIPFDFDTSKVFEKDIARAEQAQQASVGDQSEVPAAESLPRPQIPKIQDILLQRLQEAGETGSKAAPLRQYIEDTYTIEIHEKTVGMTLYRLLRKGLVRREGHIWFFVPQEDAETKNPGVRAPGLFEGR